MVAAVDFAVGCCMPFADLFADTAVDIGHIRLGLLGRLAVDFADTAVGHIRLGRVAVVAAVVGIEAVAVVASVGIEVFAVVASVGIEVFAVGIAMPD